MRAGEPPAIGPSMTESKSERAGVGEPTPFAGLNAVLAHLTDKVGEILGDNLVGLYLQGSFAVGDADEMSDAISWP